MICDKCKKPMVKFNGYKCRECRQRYLAEWHDKNRDHMNAKSREWVSNNPEKRKEIYKKSYQENRELALAYKRKHYLENKDKHKEWAKNADPSVRRAIKLRYRARKAGVVQVKYNPQDIFDRDYGLCVYCMDKATAIDHVVPISRGGADSPDNVVSACKPCNSSKQSQNLVTWLLRRTTEALAA